MDREKLGEQTAALAIQLMTEDDKPGSATIFRREDGATFHLMWGSTFRLSPPRDGEGDGR